MRGVGELSGKEMDLRVPLLATEPNEFSEMSVNSIPFFIKDPWRCLIVIFKELVNDLRLSGIISFPHKNKLFFILQVTSIDWLREFKNILTSFLGYHPDCVDIGLEGAGRMDIDDLAGLVRLERLRPCDDTSHMVIARNITYGYIRKTLWKSGVTLSSRYVNKSREGLVIYMQNLLNKDVGDAKISIVRGLRILFEITPNGRGRLWFDVATHTYSEDMHGNIKFLSHNKMKDLSRGRGVDIYSKYLELATLKPRERYKQTLEYMDALGIGSRFMTTYYVTNDLDPRQRRFNYVEVKKVFTRLHNVPQ